MSKKKVKMKKKPFLIIILVLIIIIGGIFLVFKIKNDKEIKLVKSYYHKNIITSKKTNIYNKYKRNIGTVEKNISFNLDKIDNKYFRIKDTDYYLYYEDVKENKEKIKEKTNNSTNYIPFNKNIKSSKKVNLLKEDKTIITLKGINAPIESMDKDNYYISFLNDIYKVKKDKSIKEIDSKNTKEKTSDHV